VRFFRFEGWANNQIAIYDWAPGEPKAQRLYATDAYLIDCQPRGDALLCLRETSLEPRHLVSLDPVSGKLVTLAQPNPEIVAANKGSVERILNRNEFGIPSFADLVYPVGYQGGKAYPLIVVQYTSRGFLRGGVGEEYPIQAFANAGFAVLSVNRPQDIGWGPAAKDGIDVDRLNLKDFIQRRSVLSSIETMVIDLIARGIADPKRVGITGLSDGSSTVSFAAIHSKLFSAGIVASCCWERSQNVLLGPMMEKPYGLIGWPNITQPAPDFWSQVSLAQNATKLAFPLLMQLADTEYLPALESYTALKQSGTPVDLFVFPDEYHIKWQPSHRMAAYLRSIDWFGFWFKGERPADPRRRADVDRWKGL
jgi:dipeptidyl aminopeptidase/acylaminoacyl peptidase